MKRSFVVLTCLILFTLIGCRPAAFPAPDPTAIPSSTLAPAKVLPTNTAVPTATETEEPVDAVPSEETEPTATEETSSTEDITQASPGDGEFIFAEYDLLAVYYDTQDWVSDKGMGEGYLDSLSLPGCEITGQLATEPAETGDGIELGNIQYFRTVTESPANGQKTGWYQLLNAIPTDYQDQSIIPVFLVTTPIDAGDECLSAAEMILATLHDAPQ